MIAKNIRVILDTNVWIGFLIVKRLQVIFDYIVEGNISIIISEELLTEIIDVSKRAKFKKYFPEKKVKELIDFLEGVAVETKVYSTNTLCKDPKDNFLLDLIEYSNADVLVTGDKELLKLHPFKKAHIITPRQFEQLLTT
jgi:hypothetical protein